MPSWEDVVEEEAEEGEEENADDDGTVRVGGGGRRSGRNGDNHAACSGVCADVNHADEVYDDDAQLEQSGRARLTGSGPKVEALIRSWQRWAGTNTNVIRHQTEGSLAERKTSPTIKVVGT